MVRRPRRSPVRLPAAIGGVFIAAFVLLVSGIQQTAHLTIAPNVSDLPEENAPESSKGAKNTVRHEAAVEQQGEAKKKTSRRDAQMQSARIESVLERRERFKTERAQQIEKVRQRGQQIEKAKKKRKLQKAQAIQERTQQSEARDPNLEREKLMEQATQEREQQTEQVQPKVDVTQDATDPTTKARVLPANATAQTLNATNATTLIATTKTKPPKKVPPFSPSVKYLGVMVDSGRHFFPVEWLKKLMDTLHALGFNLVHFRLTDDQAFNIQLKSHPELAKPSAVLNEKQQVYTVTQLKDLVKYAKKRGIIVMPEINVPGHAGAWCGGVPGLCVPCPHFICEKGYGVPLNIDNPKLLDIIRNVIAEVRDIFQSSPYLHLGGDEVEMSAACFQEAGIAMFNYSTFETTLQHILQDLEIPPSHVMRWEFSNERQYMWRAGKMTHYWIGHSYKQATPITAKPFFVSQGLYFDSNGQESGWSIYSQARLQATLENPPKAIVANTFELSTITWKDRNVLGRLLAVAMGASGQEYNTSAEFENKYLEYCGELKFEACSNVGMPLLSQVEFKHKWNEDWVVWKGDICNRLTVEHEEPVMSSQHDQKQHATMEASAEFWTTFGITAPSSYANSTKAKGNSSQVEQSLPEQLAVENVGLVVDLVHLVLTHPEKAQQNWIMRRIINDMEKLGFNLLQLRVMDMFGMALQLPSLSSLAFLTQGGTGFWEAPHIRDFVQYANERGIKVMPEISISTRSGGWANAGILTECPNVICNGHGISIDTRDPSVMQVIAVALRELRILFSSQYLHLGYDEREESKKCYEEAGIKDPMFGVWEQRLEAALRLEGISEEHVLRWENTEGYLYPHRAGIVTNYRNVGAVRNSSEPFFVTTDLAIQEKGSAWDLYQRVRKTTQAAPTGIMALIGVDDWELDPFMIKERLLTLAMGIELVLDDDDDEASFRTVFSKACKSLGFQQCASFVNATTLPQQKALSTEDEKKRQKIVCQAHTFPRTVKKPRVGVLIPS
jgi:N-acetyl-beta-hexosaminidase